MNELYIKYKSDTGKSPFIEFETKLYIEWLDDRILSEHTKEEILSFIKVSDNIWCVFQDEIEEKIPSSPDSGDVKIHSDEYVKWLENKITNHA